MGPKPPEHGEKLDSPEDGGTRRDMEKQSGGPMVAVDSIKRLIGKGRKKVRE